MIHLSHAPLVLKNHQPDGSFSGYASVFHLKDQQGDVISPHAFKKSLGQWQTKKTWPKLLWQHDITKPIGIFHEIQEDPHGLFVKGQLLLELVQAREAYSLLKAGVIDSLSIGFRPIKSSPYGKEKTRYIEEIDLQEISLVTFPANQGAKITDIKTIEGDFLDSFIQEIKQFSTLLQNS